MTGTDDMVAAMRRLAALYEREKWGDPPSPWMGHPASCALCKSGRYPHLHRWDWVEAIRER